MKCLLTELVCALLCVVVMTEATRLQSPRRLCGSNTACAWAVCRWSQELIVHPDWCNFLNADCQCREGTSCQFTNTEKPGRNNYVAYYYYCLPNDTTERE